MRSQRLMFDTLEECSESAESEFKKHNWTWGGKGIPNQQQIATTLLRLESAVMKGDCQAASTGRLHYLDGKFGHDVSEKTRVEQ